MPYKPEFQRTFSHSVPPCREITFHNAADGSTVTTSLLHLEEEDIPDLFSLIKSAADCEFNVGLDEYPSVDHLKSMLEFGPGFVFKESEEEKTPAIVAGLLIIQSLLQRSFRPHTCDARIFLTEKVEKANGFRKILQLAECLVKEMPGLMYDSIIVQIFSTSYRYMTIAREEKYHPCTIVPQAGHVRSQKIAQDSVVLYKEILENVQTRKTDDMGDLFAVFEESYKNFDIVGGTRKVPFLPLEHTFRKGKLLRLRNAEAGEDSQIYKCLKIYAERGEGYTMDDFPTFHIFRGYFLDDHYVLVVDDPETLDIVGYLLFGESECKRCANDYFMSDTALVIEPKYQSSGFGIEMMEIGLGIMKDVGYIATMSDYLLSNIPMYNVSSKLGYAKVGFSPKGAYREGEGWTDAIFSHLFLEKAKSFLGDLHRPPPTQQS